MPLGEFEHPLTALSTGEIYFYRIMAENAACQSWSEVATFSTGDFDFGSDSVAGGDMLLWLDSSDIDADGNFSNEPLVEKLIFGETSQEQIDMPVMGMARACK